MPEQRVHARLFGIGRERGGRLGQRSRREHRAASARHAGQRKRIIWCSTLAPSTVSGTGGRAVSTRVSGVMHFIIGGDGAAASPHCARYDSDATRSELAVAGRLPLGQAALLQALEQPAAAARLQHRRLLRRRLRARTRRGAPPALPPARGRAGGNRRSAARSPPATVFHRRTSTSASTRGGLHLGARAVDGGEGRHSLLEARLFELELGAPPVENLFEGKAEVGHRLRHGLRRRASRLRRQSPPAARASRRAGHWSCGPAAESRAVPGAAGCWRPAPDWSRRRRRPSWIRSSESR